MNFYIVIIFISLVFSAFFSGMEIAYISANRLRLELDRKQKKFPSGLLNIFIKNPTYYITTILVGNNIVLVIYGFCMTILLEPFFTRFSNSAIFIYLCQTIISTIFIIIFGEFLPKAVFRIKPNDSLNFFAIPLLLIYIIIFPVTWSIAFISSFFLKKLFGFENAQNNNQMFNKIDITNLINEESTNASENSEINRELRIFQNALEFSKVKLRDCMIPRTEICAMEVTSNMDQLKQKFIETRFSKILIYQNNIDNIIGYVSSKEIFKNPDKIQNCLLKLPFHPETMPANKLLKEFIKEKKNISVVVDEFGGTSGIVTIEDVMEEIFGEIEDEHDEIDLICKKITDSTFIFSGRLEIDLINDKYKLEIPESDDYDTIAGYVLFHHESIPLPQEEIVINNFKFKILKVTQTKLELIKLEILS